MRRMNRDVVNQEAFVCRPEGNHTHHTYVCFSDYDLASADDLALILVHGARNGSDATHVSAIGLVYQRRNHFRIRFMGAPE